MSNPLKKTMVYLGLADEELEYQAPAGAQGAANNGSTNHVSAVPARGHDNAPHGNTAHANAAQNSAGRAPVTPLRKTSTPQNVAASEMNEILTVHPRAYKDAQIIAESFREGIPVIINLSQMSDGDARRLIDFASGLSQGLYGKIERVTAKVFLLSPSHVVVSGDSTTDEGAEDSSFFAQG
ncbi:MAG: cell division protein SepF [Cryobacterium sp.]|uniref:cell division protein SepF n=1 Tax=unclassified Cryobacterium TaxID=2649013 RepID=UPI0018CBDA9E|nr:MULTISPECIES: cell division protein SepF [unclassified Cryobacterium]MCY7404541.1 cell division protein SepF [Cryobacterium sp.]MEC5153928.1 cell division inhibitor SepF [Cryobacterium sp. CAN_C3]